MVALKQARLSGLARSKGFTLVEVLIVMGIIAILTAIAYPSYTSYMTRANRSAAQGFLLELSNRQERFLLDNRGYAANIGVLIAIGLKIPDNVSANYNVTTVVPSARLNAPPTSYDVVATPIPGGRQEANDAQCGVLTMDESGHKSVSGSAGPTTCWRS